MLRSGVSHPSEQEHVEVVAAEHVGGGTSMEDAKGRGTVDGEADAEAIAPPEVVEKAVEDNVYAIEDTLALGEPAQKVN